MFQLDLQRCSEMASNLVIVESPAKARSIQKYLGKNYEVIASMGHIMDLPKKEGIAIEKVGSKWVFTPRIEKIKGKDKTIKIIKASSKKSEHIFLATDPDREGEVIAYHISNILDTKSNVKRVMFHEITPAAVRAAFEEPKEIDIKLVESQQARRVLDRIVGFDVSQLLWDKVARGLSAGRVQSVSLRMIVEREREIRRFVPVESWTIHAIMEKDGVVFEAQLASIGKNKPKLPNQESSAQILTQLKGKILTVSNVEKSEKKRYAQPPFITSTLQQEAARRLGYPVSFTMKLAQSLYEGIDLGEEGPTGLITYMRTDSVRVSEAAILDARKHIETKLGKDFLSREPIRYRTSKSAQDAHEAIRPTSVLRTPSSVSKYLDKKALALYKLIWNRFVASQCSAAIYESIGVDLSADDFIFRATGSRLLFQGFLKVYSDVESEDKNFEANESIDSKLPNLKVGDQPSLEKFEPRQHFTQPPARFSEAMLVKSLEEKGIGRPSTYASIISTLKDRHYTFIEKRRLVPTDLGMSVSDLLVKAFPDIFNFGFTAEMETELDEIEEGSIDWQKVLNNFYSEFLKDMANANKQMPNLKIGIPTKYKCPSCKATLNLRYGKNGRFLACSSYPDCNTTFEVEEDNNGELKKLDTPKFEAKCPKCGSEMLFKRSRLGAFLACGKYPACRGLIPLKKIENNNYEIVEPEKTERKCPECGGAMEVKQSRFGRFLACEKYPECKGALPYFINVPCPREGCKGELRERVAKKGVYYTCSAYPECKYRSNVRPVAVICPECSSPAMIPEKDGTLKCARSDCKGIIERKQ